MRHNVEFKHYSPTERVRRLVEESMANTERYVRHLPDDTVFLHVLVEENAPRKLYQVSITLEVPGRTLAAKEDRHDDEEALRAAFLEVERQLLKHKDLVSHSYLYKRPARRAALRRAKGEPNPS